MPRLPKLHGLGLHPNQAYCPEEIAEAAGVEAATVRLWIRTGKLPAMTKGKPHLALGCDVVALFKSMRSAPTRMAKDEFRCMHCRTARRAWDRVADLFEQSRHLSRLEALCEVCGGTMSKGVSVRDLPVLRTLIDIRPCGASGNDPIPDTEAVQAHSEEGTV